MSEASDIVPLADAAERIGRPHQWLRRHLLTVEKRTGQSILERVGEGSARPTYRVHMGRLRVVCPALFDVRDQVAAALRESTLIGQRDLADLKNNLDEIDAKIGAMAAGIRQLNAAQKGQRR